MDAVCLKCGDEIRRDGLMHRAELRAIRGLLGVRGGHGAPLSQAAFAKLLGISPRGLRNYETGERRIPTPVAREARRLKAEVMTPRSRTGGE